MQKVFRDPIYNLITFDKEKDLLLLKLIDTYEFQRLRRIRQLGVSWLTYPTAVHTRFSHSLGVAYLAGKIFDQLNLKDEIQFEDEDDKYTLTRDQLKLLLQTTALLHDIGHGPFSHAFESVMDQDHEDWSVKIITSSETNINKIILADDEGLNKIISLKIRKKFPKWISDILNGIFPLYFIKEIISSQLDADRLDYLLRDAYMCGVDYARFDLDWILNNIDVGEISHEANIIISRYHMYEQVYFHKTTRAAEKLIQAIFLRLKELVQNNEMDKIGPLDASILAVINDDISISQYLELDDFLIITYIKKWKDESKDEILKHLCSNFLNRVLYKLVAEEENAGVFTPEQHRALNRFFTENEINDNYYFAYDSYTDVPYKDDYLFGKKRSEEAGHIWLINKDENLIELGEASDIIKALRNNLKIKNRAYCDRSIYSQLKENEILN